MIEKIGILGGGQLGRMLTQAALPLGYTITVVDPTPNCPAAKAGAQQILGKLDDRDCITELAKKTQVISWEIEHISADILEELFYQGYNIQPSPLTLKIIQNKFTQKQMLSKAGLPVADFISLTPQKSNVAKKTHLMEVARKLGGEIILKTKTGGYDGRGNLVYRDNLSKIDDVLGKDWHNIYAERVIPFNKELSVVAARDIKGNISLYPIAETVHKKNICHTAVTPANINPKVAGQAQEVAYETLKQLEGAGVFAIEMFATDDTVIINEIAPRVHNSGHHTIEANVTSQFEQHIRAVTGMPLGSTALRAQAACMINILGKRTQPLSIKGIDKILALPDTHLHLYGKASRKGRKIGHITVLADSVSKAVKIANRAKNSLQH